MIGCPFRDARFSSRDDSLYTKRVMLQMQYHNIDSRQPIGSQYQQKTWWSMTQGWEDCCNDAVDDDGPFSMYRWCILWRAVNNGYVDGMTGTKDSIGEGTLSWMRWRSWLPLSLQGFVIVPSRQLGSLSVDDNVIYTRCDQWSMINGQWSMVNRGSNGGGVHWNGKMSRQKTIGDVDVRCELMTMIQVNEG